MTYRTNSGDDIDSLRLDVHHYKKTCQSLEKQVTHLRKKRLQRFSAIFGSISVILLLGAMASTSFKAYQERKSLESETAQIFLNAKSDKIIRDEAKERAAREETTLALKQDTFEAAGEWIKKYAEGTDAWCETRDMGAYDLYDCDLLSETSGKVGQIQCSPYNKKCYKNWLVYDYTPPLKRAK